MGNRSRKRTCRGILKRASGQAELTDLGNSCLRTGAQDEQAQSPRRTSHQERPPPARPALSMAVEKFLDLARVYVLATADHHVLRAPDDVQ